MLDISAAPVAQHVSRWERALPQYNIGHERTVAALRELCAKTPGVFLGGNYLAGPSLGACVEHANEVADRAARFFSAGAR
jgi:oxygen-dependent protoporphyrinogen oxidase